MKRIVTLLTLLAATANVQSSEALAHRATTVIGTVKAGRCEKSLTLVTDTNEAYELDPTRTKVKIGERAVFQGSLYPRISLCKAHAWLDVQSVAPIALLAASAVTNTSQATEVNDKNLTGGTVVLVVALSDLPTGLKNAQRIKSALPPTSIVAVGVPTSQRNLLPKLFEATRSNFDLMKGVHVMALSEGRAGSVIVRNGETETPFANIDVYLSELKNRAAHPG